MSNFDFLNHAQYLNFPSCRVLYENAMLAENAYFSDHEECALRVRVVLEQFCIFGSELKKAEYPDTVFRMESYWNPQNRWEFIKTFGNRNAALIKRTSAISGSFLYSDIPTREDVYPEMFRNIYILLLWLYQELGMKTPLLEKDYSIRKIPGEPVLQGVDPQIQYSTEQMLGALKIFFPDCNTEKLCDVRKAGDKYLVVSPAGELLEEMEAPETVFFSEGKAELLRSRLAEIKKEFDLKTREYIQGQSACDSQIVLLELQLEEGAGTGRKEHLLRQEIQELENNKQQISEFYRDELAALAGKYEETHEKYNDLLPAVQNKSEMQERMKGLLKERADMEIRYEKQQGSLLQDVRDAKTQLEKTERSMNALNLSIREGNVLLEQLNSDLTEKERALEATLKQVQKEYANTQKESAKAIEQYKNCLNNTEVILTQMLFGNLKCKKMHAGLDQSEEIMTCLQIVKEETEHVNEGIASYRETLNNPEIKACLLRVQEQYDNRIREAKEELRQRQDDFTWEKKKYEGLLNSLNEEEEPVEEAEQPAEEKQEAAVTEETKEEKQELPESFAEYMRTHTWWKWVLAAGFCILLGILIVAILGENVEVILERR